MEELPYLVDVDVRMDAPGHSKSMYPHVTKHVRLPKDGDVVLPLKKIMIWLIFLRGCQRLATSCG